MTVGCRYPQAGRIGPSGACQWPVGGWRLSPAL